MKLFRNAYALVLAIVAVLSLLSSAAMAQNVVDRDGFAEAVGWDFDAAEIKTQKVADGVWVLFGLGGNIVASVGEQGVLLVDDQFPELIPRIEETLKGLGASADAEGNVVDFVINTHWHFDHADGNLALGKKGAWLVSHVNSRNMLVGDHRIDLVRLKYDQKAYPVEARPVITYDDRMQFFWNGERIDLMNFGAAHTKGDTAVFFRSSNVLHMGDVFNATGYPFLDAGNGGSLEGAIQFCRSVLAEINEETTVVPGHGAVATYQDMVEYVEILEAARNNIADLIEGGASLLEVIEARPTAQWDSEMGDPTGFIDRSYFSLVRKQ